MTISYVFCSIEIWELDYTHHFHIRPTVVDDEDTVAERDESVDNRDAVTDKELIRSW